MTSSDMLSFARQVALAMVSAEFIIPLQLCVGIRGSGKHLYNCVVIIINNETYCILRVFIRSPMQNCLNAIDVMSSCKVLQKATLLFKLRVK